MCFFSFFCFVLEKCTHQTNETSSLSVVSQLRQANWNNFRFLLDTHWPKCFCGESLQHSKEERLVWPQSRAKTNLSTSCKANHWWMKNWIAYNDQLLEIVHVNTCTELHHFEVALIASACATVDLLSYDDTQLNASFDIHTFFVMLDY